MGLLTNPNAGSGGLSAFLERHHGRISLLLYLFGAAGILVLPHPWSFSSEKTYFSENALLPGLVQGEFSEGGAAKQYLEELRREAAEHPNTVPFPWLKASLARLGLEVHSHNFTLRYPLGHPENYTGENVYAILRAQRASRTEALVLSVPYRPPNSLEQGTEASVAVMLASAKFFRKQLYWAKDIIFLVTQVRSRHVRFTSSDILLRFSLSARTTRYASVARGVSPKVLRRWDFGAFITAASSRFHSCSKGRFASLGLRRPPRPRRLHPGCHQPRDR